MTRPWLLLAVTCAGLAVWLVVQPARGQRLEQKSSVFGWLGGSRAGRRWLSIIRPRPDALSYRQRFLAGAAVGLTTVMIVPVVLVLPQGLVWPISGAAGLGTVIILGQWESVAARRRRIRLIVETPQALELLAACLVAGLPLRAATQTVARVFPGPLANDLDQVITGIALGADDATAWRLLSGHPQLGTAAVDLARSADSGTMLVEALRHHAELSRRRRSAELEAQAKKVGVRCVLPLMVCFLPAFLCIGIVPTIVSALLTIFR